MWWSKVFAVVLTLAVAACGFTPMYGSGGAQHSQLARGESIYIENITDRHGQFLRNELIDRLYTTGRPANAMYTLKVSKPSEKEVSLGIKKDASSTITQKTMRITMELTKTGEDTPVLTRSFSTSASYNILDNQFATLVSERSITENILKQLADDVVNDLNLYFYNRQKQ